MTEQPKLYCSICKAETKEIGKPDDVGTQFYRCKNGHQTTKALDEQGLKVNLAFEIQAEQNGEKHYVDPLNPMAAFCNGKEVFKTALVALYLHYNYHFKIDRTTEILYFGDEKTGLWKTKGEIYLQEILSDLLGEENTKSHYTNILHDLKGLSYTDVVFSKKIAVENGLFDVETGELTKPTLEEMAYYTFPVKYDKEAKKLENWLEFLKQVANPDDIPLLQEWFGFCLLPDYRFHKVLWIHGDGRNGKGVFDRTIQGTLGKNNVSALGLEELDGSHRFALSNLFGKLYNTCSEPTTNKIFRTEIFQKVSGGDTIKAELKGANDRVEFVNCAKLTIIGNRFPKIDSPTTAFKDRMMFVKFPNFFSDKDRIANLENVWLNDPEQKSALLNWALDGLWRLIAQNGFTQTKTQRETEIEFNRVSNSIGAFQMEVGIISKNLTTTRAEALTAYGEYCEDIGVEPQRASTFTQGMLKLSPKVKDGWTRVAGKKERAWIGFGLRNVEQMPQLEQQKLPENIENQNSLVEQEENSVPNVPSVPNSSEYQLKVETEPSGLKRLETSKPRFYVKEIPVGPKCDCGKLAVTLEIVTPQHDTLKRCTDCLEKLKAQFPGAVFCAAYPDMPSYEGEAA